MAASRIAAVLKGSESWGIMTVNSTRMVADADKRRAELVLLMLPSGDMDACWRLPLTTVSTTSTQSERTPSNVAMPFWNPLLTWGSCTKSIAVTFEGNVTSSWRLPRIRAITVVVVVVVVVLVVVLVV